MKTRIHNMINTKTLDLLYGVNVLHDGKWRMYVENGKLYYTENKQEAEDKRKKLMATK